MLSSVNAQRALSVGNWVDFVDKHGVKQAGTIQKLNR